MRRLLVVILFAACLLVAPLLVIAAARHSFGPPTTRLGQWQVLEYSARLLWADGLLTRAPSQQGTEIDFEVEQGESVESICQRLQTDGLITDARVLKDYLIYTGKDTTLQAGNYKLSASRSMVDLAGQMQDATPTEVPFVVLAGWRIEEIAEALPTSGLTIEPAEFVAAAAGHPAAYEFLAGATTTEGFLYPDSYVLSRGTSARELVEAMVRNFDQRLTQQLRDAFARQGLSVYEAVILASIVEREAVRLEEAPLIASVYLNRLRAGMRLDADPTVQYAIGFNPSQQTWWTNPLSYDDLKIPSPYNTYIVGGLPPAPISNPGLEVLSAVADPASSAYYYFQAQCDRSGFHAFSETFEEHLSHLCP
jgi:UPF0755 protein